MQQLTIEHKKIIEIEENEAMVQELNLLAKASMYVEMEAMSLK